MRWSRRSFLGALAILGLYPVIGAGAQGTRRVDVVKILSFGCAVCRASESHDRLISRKVEEGGGRYVWAPVPTLEGETGNRERTYYASRADGREFEAAVRQSLYKAAHDMGLPLADWASISTWLQGDLHRYDRQVDALLERASHPTTRESLVRALRLGELAGASSLPAYVLVTGGQILAMVDSSSATGASMLAMRDSVIATFEQMTGK